MVRLTILIVIIFVTAVIAGGFYLAYGNFSVPPTPVQKVLPDARFPK